MKKKIICIVLMALLAIKQPSAVWGNENIENKQEEIYGIGSVSKMFGTAAIMKLIDRGEINLDAPVTDYIPEFTMADDRFRQITVRMLLNHSSGIMGTTQLGCFLFGESDVDYHQILLENLKTQRLKADPGAFSVYCNDGFTLAEIIVERVSGMDFKDYIKKEITQPLGMENTGIPAVMEKKEDFAPIYYKDRLLPFENIQSLASGGIFSTPEDLLKFSETFMGNGNGLLSKEAVSAMASLEYKNNIIGVQEGDSVFGYGLGWDSVDAYPFSQFGIKALMKGGDAGNYGAGLIVLPDQNISAAVTVSGGSGQYCEMMAQEIITWVLKEEGIITAEREKAVKQPEKEVSIPAEMPIPEEIKKYAGLYASNEIFQVEFTKQNTLRLTLLENNSDMVQEYHYTKDGDFISTNGKYISYTGLTQASGGISGFTKFRFKEEANGKTYIMGTTYTMAGGSIESAITEPFAEKIEENPLPFDVAGAWEARDGKKYYLVNDAYNSGYNMKTPCVKVETMKACQGYTGALSFAKNCRIVDEDNAVCELELPVMIGRDLMDYKFYRENGLEYLKLGGYLFQEAGGSKDSGEFKNSITLGAMAQWYQTNDADAGREIQINVPEDGAYYIFDKDDNCVSTSLFPDEKKSVLLPKGGKVLLSGKEGSIFHISR